MRKQKPLVLRVDRSHLGLAGSRQGATCWGKTLLDPPGHAERLAAHAARVARDQPSSQLGPAPGRAPAAVPKLRLRVLLALAAAGRPLTLRELRAAAGCSACRLSAALRGCPWFVGQQRRLATGGSLPRLVSLTTAGREEARHIRREES